MKRARRRPVVIPAAHLASHVERTPAFTPLSATALAGLALLTLDAPAAQPPRAFRDPSALWDAFDRDELAFDTPVRVLSRTTTAGRALVCSLAPPRVQALADAAWTHDLADHILTRIQHELHVELAARCAGALERLGTSIATRAALSPCIDDLLPQVSFDAIESEARATTEAINRQYWDEAMITDGERYNKTFEVWCVAHDKAANVALQELPSRSIPFRVLLAALPAPPDLAHFAPFARVPFRNFGELHEVPLQHSLAQGLSPHDAWMTYASSRERRARARTAVDAPVLHSIARDLLQSLLPVTVTADDCGDPSGEPVELDPELDPEPWLGRPLARDVALPHETLAPRGTRLHNPLWERCLQHNVPTLYVRTALLCQSPHGVCRVCVGPNPVDGTPSHPGDRVGARAAWALIERVASLPTPPWLHHIC